MAEQPPPLELQHLPLCVLARIFRRVASTDGRAATALASSCRLLAAVAADELLIFAPLCRELANSCGAGVCIGAWSSRGTPRPHASAYVALRVGAWLTGNLWRGAGDEADRLFAFLWRSDGAVECTELEGGHTVRPVCVCRVGGDASLEARPAVMDVLRLDDDRCALRVPPVRVAVSAVAAAIVGKCASPVGSPSSNFALEYLQHTHTLVQSRDSRRRARANAANFALVRAARLDQMSLVFSTSRPEDDKAAINEDAVADAAAGVTRVRCSKHTSSVCHMSLYWLRGGRLLACCTSDGGPPRDVRRIAPLPP